MNKRILTIVGAVTLLCSTTGCSGMRNFLFGRGARCGACSATRPLAQVNPLNWRQSRGIAAPVTPSVLPAPVIAAPRVEAGCGHEIGCGMEAGCGREVIAPPSCNCGPSSSYGPAVSNYGPAISSPSIVNPYLSESVIGSGQIIEGAIIGTPYEGTVIDGGYSGGAITGSWEPRSYSANKYDQDGHRIISEDPLPPGAIPAN